MRSLLLGDAPWWAAFALWLVLSAAAVLLWRALRRQDERERRARRDLVRRLVRRERRQLNALLVDFHHRLQVIENHLGITYEPTEDDR